MTNDQQKSLHRNGASRSVFAITSHVGMGPEDYCMSGSVQSHHLPGVTGKETDGAAPAATARTSAILLQKK